MADTQDSTTKRSKPSKLIVGIFSGTLAVFIFSITYIFAQELIPNVNRYIVYIMGPAALLLVLLGTGLIVFTARARLTRGLKLALVLTGVSAIGMPLSAVLHNLVYGLMIMLLGKDYWGGASGGDEAVFFILAVIIFPAMLIISAIASGVLLLNSSRNGSA